MHIDSQSRCERGMYSIRNKQEAMILIIYFDPFNIMLYIGLTQDKFKTTSKTTRCQDVASNARL